MNTNGKAQLEGSRQNTRKERRELKDPKLIDRNAYHHTATYCMLIFWSIISIIPHILCATIENIFRKKKSVKNKLCLVTGSGRGLGRSIAQSMAKLGAKVICVDINEKTNSETVELITAEGGCAAAYTVNVSKFDEVLNLAQKVEKEHGPVDILVNNACLVMGMTVEEWDPAEIVASFNVNVLSHYWMIKAFLPTMKERNSGQIVAISSVSALISTLCLSIYGATKAAISNLMDNLLQEVQFWEKKNIKFTTIHPFFVNTSEDYSSYLKMKLKPMSITTATRKIIDAILYEKESVSIPGHMAYIAPILRLLPSKTTNMLIHLVGAVPLPPNKETRESLVYYDIVNESQNMI